jgi:hypothetical protein
MKWEETGNGRDRNKESDDENQHEKKRARNCAMQSLKPLSSAWLHWAKKKKQTKNKRFCVFL